MHSRHYKDCSVLLPRAEQGLHGLTQLITTASQCLWSSVMISLESRLVREHRLAIYIWAVAVPSRPLSTALD